MRCADVDPARARSTSGQTDAGPEPSNSEGTAGTRRRKVVYGRTRAEVVAKLRTTAARVEQQLPLPDERQTTGSYLSWWVETVVPGQVRPRTAEMYAGVIRRYVIPALGKLPLAKLTPQHVHSMLAAMDRRGLSRATILGTRAVLRRALTHAERWGLVARNVAALVDPPRVAKARTDDALTLAEAHQLLAAARGDRLEALVTVALALGLRKGEALGLTWDVIDFDARTLAVLQTLDRLSGVRTARAGAGLVVGEPKTTRSRRTVPLPDVCVDALKTHRKRQVEERLAVGPAWHDTGFVFTTSVGTPIDPRNLTNWFHTLTARAGLGRRRFHALRHSAVTLALAQGVPLEVVSRMVGHSSITVTADVYAHLVPALQRQAADAMDRALRHEP